MTAKRFRKLMYSAVSKHHSQYNVPYTGNCLLHAQHETPLSGKSYQQTWNIAYKIYKGFGINLPPR